MQKLIENNIFKINYPDSLQELTNNTIKILQTKIDEYKKLFNIEINDKIIVNYFDNYEEFKRFIRKIRGEKSILPNYIKSTYDKGMINAYIEKDTQLNNIYTPSHELFHIYYMKYVLKGEYKKRIIWYDEGMAQYMSGEKDKYNDEKEFKKFYLKVKESTKEIPKLNNLTHGESFCNNKYNGYDLSYLSIKYLNETLTKENFIKLMSDYSNIKKYGNNIITKMFKFYDKKLNIKEY